MPPNPCEGTPRKHSASIATAWGTGGTAQGTVAAPVHPSRARAEPEQRQSSKGVGAVIVQQQSAHAHTEGVEGDRRGRGESAGTAEFMYVRQVCSGSDLHDMTMTWRYFSASCEGPRYLWPQEKAQEGKGASAAGAASCHHGQVVLYFIALINIKCAAHSHCPFSLLSPSSVFSIYSWLQSVGTAPSFPFSASLILTRATA